MDTKYVLISGSAAPDCDVEKLARAIQFSAAVTGEVIKTGNGVAVLAAREPTREGEDGSAPLTFDWTVLRAVAQTLEDGQAEAGSVLARVVTGTDSIAKRFSPENARLIQDLQTRWVIDVQHLEESRYYGGSYRDVLAGLADALIVVGGGKGTYDMGKRMLEAGKPVMAMDIAIGSRYDDGGGALQLLSEMKTNGQTFLPRHHQVVGKNLYALSLEYPVWPIRRVATAVSEIVAGELEDECVGNCDARNEVKGWLFKLFRKSPQIAQSAYHTARTVETIEKLFQ